MIIDESVYLEHHGVKGMKWGVRKEDDLVGGSGGGSEKKSGTSSKKDDESKSGFHLTPTQKKIAIGGAIFVGAAALTYGAYKMGDSGQLNALALRSKQALGKQAGPWKVDPKLADPNLSADQIQSLVNSKCNPGYGKFGTKMNCRRSTFAYEMRRRGYDVSATRTKTGVGQDFVGGLNALNADGGKVYGSSKRSLRREVAREARNVKKGIDHTPVNDAFDFFEGAGRRAVEPKDGSHGVGIFLGLLKEPNGSRGEVTMDWSSGGRHSMAYEIVNHRPILFDPQTGEKFESARDLRQSIGDAAIDRAATTRLDNLPMNEAFLQRWLRNA